MKHQAFDITPEEAIADLWLKHSMLKSEHEDMAIAVQHENRKTFIRFRGSGDYTVATSIPFERELVFADGYAMKWISISELVRILKKAVDGRQQSGNADS